MKLLARVKKVNRLIERGIKNNKYIKAYKSPVNEKAFLLEAGQGKTINGNVFALLRYIRSEAEFDDYTVYLTVTEDVRESAEKRLSKYCINNVTLVERNDDDYKRALGSFKYLITDNSFPAYLNKRKEQVYINTWHGTPLKALGRTDLENSASLANVQANMLKADYLLHPNAFTKNIMMKDYMVERLFKNKTVVIDYPRNDALYKQEYKEEILSKYGLEGKRLIAYMPTWRGVGRSASIEEQVRDVERIVNEIESRLKEDELLCVNLHFLVGNRIDFSNYEKVITFPSEYETYDFLALCDTLITDYSSVAIDFAGTGKEVILYMYDYEQYKADKGFYVDIKSLPFKQSFDINELEKSLHSKKNNYNLDKMFLSDNRGDSCKQVIDLICKGKEDGLDIQDYSGNKEGLNLVFFENIRREENQKLLRAYHDKLSDEEKKKTVIGFQDKITKETASILKSMDDNIEYVRVPKSMQKNTIEGICVAFNKKLGLFEGTANAYYRREAGKLLGIMALDKVSVMQNRSIEKFRVFSKADAHTVLYRFPTYFYGRNGARFLEKPKSFARIEKEYESIESFPEDESAMFWDELKCYGVRLRIKNQTVTSDENKLTIKGTAALSVDADFDILDTAIVSNNEYVIKEKPSCEKGEDGITRFNGAFELSIPLEDMKEFHKHNRIFLQMRIAESTILIPVRYEKARPMQQTTFDIVKGELICFIRNGKGLLDLEVRPANYTDSAKERVKLYIAWLCSRVTPFYKPIILYEKDSSRYEESASCVYEHLIDKGYKHVHFLLSKDYEHRDSIPDKYKKNLIDRFSFKHYYSIFAAKSLIATESPAHSLEPNSKSETFLRYVVKGRQNYVFLQHGVMYMVSLNSESRSFFRKVRLKRAQRVVVSSELEAQHFMEYAGYNEADMYISGLPKFDKSEKYDDADRITVMLTWRPWEYNQANIDFKKTKYYQMLERIIASVPDEYLDKLIVLPHPRVASLADSDKESNVWKYSIFDEKYDDILKRTKVLITDYSSISFDAFYRGSNVIFCWSEKDECMAEYGPSTRLMLTEDLAFGPVAYDENIRDCIIKQYTEDQSEEYKKKFQKIVVFHDGQNTERVVKMMEKDMII